MRSSSMRCTSVQVELSASQTKAEQSDRSNFPPFKPSQPRFGKINVALIYVATLAP